MNDVAFKVGNALYNSGCLKFGSFRIKSGALSPYYIDIACLLSSPKDLCTVINIAAYDIKRIAASAKIDKLASIELKGVLLLASIGYSTGLPCTVVRKEDKTYGTTGRIAGANVKRGERILFFDDVVSEGLSKLEDIKPLERMGAKVEDIMVVVDREQGGTENLENAGYKVHALAKVSDIVQALLQNKRISKKQAETIIDYVKKT